mgnify:CR=1 FL=1
MTRDRYHIKDAIAKVILHDLLGPVPYPEEHLNCVQTGRNQNSMRQDFQQLITAGHIYIAQPPLFLIKHGKEAEYVYNEDALDDILKKFQKNPPLDTSLDATSADAKALADKQDDINGEEPAAEDESMFKVKGVNIQRYKGLGEMNPEQLWETTMDPANRVLKLVTIEDAEEANKVFDVLMGSDVAPRKRFIQTHAKNVKNLDI